MEMFESYMKQVMRYELLDAEKEIALSKEIEKGNKKAVNELVQANLRLVVSVAKKLNASVKVSVMDLIQEGNIGLMIAATKYHYSFNTRFSTYAYSWILQYMLRFLYNKTSMIALPHRKDELLRRIAAAQNFFIQRTGKEASVPELSRYLGVPSEDIQNVLAYSYTFTSIDYECSEDGRATIADMIPDNKYNPEERLMVEETKSYVRDLVETLPEKERTVIYSRFNFQHGRQIPTLRELSASLDVSAETVRQMEIRAVRKMKKNAFKMKIAELFTA